MKERYTPVQPENPQDRITQLTRKINSAKRDFNAIHSPWKVNGISISDSDAHAGTSDLPFGLTLLPSGLWGDRNRKPLDKQSVTAALAEFAVATSSDLQAVHYQIDDVIQFIDSQFDKQSISAQEHTTWFEQAEAKFRRITADYVKSNKIPLLEELNKAMQEAIASLQQSSQCY